MEKSINLGIRQLPEEILEKALLLVPTKDLLRTTRLVSKRWRRISTAICRQRCVQLGGIYRIPKPKIDFSIFNDSVDLPWSSYTIFKESFSSFNPSLCTEEFWNRFGCQLRKLTLKVDRCVLHTMLKFTPNLRYLTLVCRRQGQDFLPLGFDGKVNLPFLKCLKMLITDSSMNLLDFVVSSSPGLDKVKLRIADYLSIETVAKLPSLLGSIPNIHLKINCYERGEEVLSAIASRKLNLTFDEPARRNRTYFSPIEAILTNSVETLRSLKLKCMYGSGRSRIPLQFPILPALKVLNIRFEDVEFADSHNFMSHLFSTVTTHHFPVLEKVKVHLEMEEHCRFGSSLFYRKDKKDRCQFPSVKELEMNTSRIQEDWSKLFPGLIRLKAKVEDEHFLVRILLTMVGLEHLDLSFNVHEFIGFDLKETLSGVDPYLARFPQTQAGQSVLCTTCARQPSRYPSVFRLAVLRTLELTCEDGETKLDDSGADLALLPLHPLGRLCLRNQNISDDCKARLMARHNIVEVYNN